VAFELGVLVGRHSIPLRAAPRLAVTCDGRLAALYDGAVHWYDPQTLAETAVWPAARVPEPREGQKVHSGTMALAVRPDGAIAHGGHELVGPGTVVWRDAAGKVRHQLAGHAAPIAALAF